MGLFNKKEKKPREIKEDDSLFIKLWYNPRTHALMVLGAYLVFFLVVILVLSIGSKTNEISKSVLGKDTKKLFDYYLDKNTTYNYVINKAGKAYYFSGNKVQDNDVVGTLLSDGNSKLIYVSAGLCSVVNNVDGQYVPIEGDMCPTDIEYNYFDITYIYMQLENLKTTSSSVRGRYNFVLNNDYNYKLYYNNDKVEKIEVNDKGDSYVLTLGEKEEVVSDNDIETIDNEENI